MSAAEARRGSGVLFGLAAYGLWGVVPLYWKALHGFAPIELLAQRVLWSLCIAIVLLAVTRGFGVYRDVLRSPRHVLPVAAAALLLAVNWLVFIHAVATDRVLATSLGYYLNPLVNVALGMLVLRERLRPLQAVAVLLAACGVGFHVVAMGSLPWIAVVLAGTFGLYGLVRKVAPVEPVVGFGVEMSVLAVPSAVLLLALGWRGSAQLPSGEVGTDLLVAASGLVTAAPLLCFNAATRRLTLVTVGILQYLAPSLALALAVLSFGEPFERVHAVTFGLVWTGLAVFTLESAWSAGRARQERRSRDRAAEAASLAPLPD